jgi:hypothetical protein
MSKYLAHFPKPLLEDLVNGRWLPVVGAGMSLNAKLPPSAKMPLWSELGKIDKKLLDEHLSFDFWSDELIGAYQDNKAFIDFMREEDNAPFSYHTLEKIYRRWAARDEKDRRMISKRKGNESNGKSA